MSQVRKYGVAAGTFAVALGIGFVMQNGDVLAARMGADVPGAPEVADVPVLPAVAEATTVPALPEVLAPSTPDVASFEMPSDVTTPTMNAPGIDMAAADLSDLATLDAAPLITADVDPLAQPAVEPSLPMVPTEMADADVETLAPETLAPVTPDTTVATTETTFSDAPFEVAVADTAQDLEDAFASPSTPQAEGCTPDLQGVAGIAATVSLSLTAPCATEMAITLHHQGMMFTVLTDEAGQATVTVPALAETSVFIADIGGQDGAVAVVSVPDVAMYDRSVLQWQGDTGLQMHAREFGAEYESEGHVWQAAARDMAAAVTGEGGYMILLGDPRLEDGMMAEVYTYPTLSALQDGDVLMTVEAEVTEANCGRLIAAQSIQVAPGAEPVARDLEMTLPSCDAVGEFLVLNNMLEDLTLASQ